MADPLFKGLTRPAMFFGVTYAGFLLNMMMNVILFLIFYHPIWLLMMFPIHGVMFLICRWDVRFFDIIQVFLMTKGADSKRALFKASSYRP